MGGQHREWDDQEGENEGRWKLTQQQVHQGLSWGPNNQHLISMKQNNSKEENNWLTYKFEYKYFETILFLIWPFTNFTDNFILKKIYLISLVFIFWFDNKI